VLVLRSILVNWIEVKLYDIMYVACMSIPGSSIHVSRPASRKRNQAYYIISSISWPHRQQ
jgi:hypothetical protein